MAAQNRPPKPVEHLPHSLGRYELHTELGAGGMATVYAAWLSGPAGFRKEVAVKVIKPEALQQSNGKMYDAFILEARLGGLLKHPNIVDVYELSEVDGKLLISMELVRGMTLWEIIRSGHAPPPAVLLEVAIGIAAGLASAHALTTGGHQTGLVHRDLKPSNVMVSWDGSVKVMDFGIATTQVGELARATQTLSSGRGTPSYMSPEQLVGQTLDGRSDLFAFGLVLTELALAQFQPHELLFRSLLEGRGRDVPLVSESEHSRLDTLIPGLSAIVRRCLQPYPQLRFDGSAALLTALEGLRGTVGVGQSLRVWLQCHFRALPNPDRGTVASSKAETATLPMDVCLDSQSSTPLPALPPLKVKRTNLLPRPDHFVGREAQLRAIQAHFDAGSRLVTLKGTGGVGKTRLATRYAREQVEALDGGAWFIDLAEVVSRHGVVQSAALALGVRLRGGSLDALASAVGRALASRGPMLLVVDNLEQMPTSAVKVLGDWLHLAPSVRILATSRTPLLLHGEALLELLPLNDNDGLQLFQRRARAAGGQWADTPENRSAIQRIVRKVDALPLAIELAAARSRALTPMQIETRLSQRFQLLRGIRRGETDRHASLRGLIDWSWELLAPWEQASLAQLSVFRDGFFMESAEKVLDLSLWPDAPWALDVVGALLDKSLLYSMDSGSQPRFRMYRSVRAYAEERLEGAARGPRVRHLFHFSTLGADALLEDFFQTKRADLALMLQAERENLRVATETALGFGMPELGGRCALAMGFERQFQGPSEDVIHLIERVIERPISQPLLGRLHRRLGWLHYVDGRSDMAMARFEASRSIHHAIGETNQEAFAIGNLGNCLFQSGKVAQAIEHFEESLELHWEVGNRYGVGSIFGRLASAHETRGNRDKALQFHQRSLALARQRNDTAGEAVALHNIGQFLEVAGDPTQAQAHLRAAIKLAAQHHDHKGLAISMAALGGSLRDTGRFDEVPPLYAESMRLRREVGNRGMIGILLGGQGVLLLKTGDLEGAEHLLQEALEHLRNKRGFAPGLFGAWLAVVEARNGSIDAARRRIHAAAPQLEGFRPTLRGTLRCLQATVELLAGHREAYEAALTSAITINESSALGATSKLMRMVQEVRSEAVHLRGWRPPTAVTR